MDTPDDFARELDEAQRASDREPSVIELMNGPGRPTEERRKTVLWISLAFSMMMLAATIFVIVTYGPDLLTLITLAIMVMLVAAMIGALRYKGEDPLEHLEPPELPERRFGRRRK